jgi:hypothetical protein
MKRRAQRRYGLLLLLGVLGLLVSACGGSDDPAGRAAPSANEVEDAAGSESSASSESWPGPYVEHEGAEETRSFTRSNFSNDLSAAQSGPALGSGILTVGTAAFEFDAHRCPVERVGLQPLGTFEIPKIGTAVVIFDAGTFSVRLSDGRVFNDEEALRHDDTHLSGDGLVDYFLQVFVIDELATDAYGPGYLDRVNRARDAGDQAFLDEYTERVVTPLSERVPRWQWSLELSCGSPSNEDADSNVSSTPGDEDPDDCTYRPSPDRSYFEIEVYESTTCAEAEAVVAAYEASGGRPMGNGWTCYSGDLAELNCEGATRNDAFLATPMLADGGRVADEYDSPAG